MTPEEVIQAFGPMNARFDYSERFRTDPPLLAHYTSVETLEKILRNGEIWFSNPLFMNDLEEMRFGLNEGAELFHTSRIVLEGAETPERAAKLREAFRYYFMEYDGKHAYDTYVFCLSEHERENTDGILSMWRGYGGHGRGVALVFDAAKVTWVAGSPLIIAKVDYASAKKRMESLENILAEWAGIMRPLKLPDNQLYLAAKVALDAIKFFALTTKHDGFSEEQEWRAIYSTDVDHRNLLHDMLDYSIGPRGIEPKLKFKVGHIEGLSAPDLAVERLLDRILLGPSVSNFLARKGIERMRERIGKGHMVEMLRDSTIPLRPT